MARRFGYNQSSNKFGASKVVFKGIKFDSTYERDRYIYLCHLQKKGLIGGYFGIGARNVITRLRISFICFFYLKFNISNHRYLQ